MEPLLIAAFISVVAASVFLEVSGWSQSVPSLWAGRLPDCRAVPGLGARERGLMRPGALLGACACREVGSGRCLKPKCYLGAG